MWLATIQFPDGTLKYATYSTVVKCPFSDLYADMVPEGGKLLNGSACYRAEVAGEPEPN
jgi:hypothetical protein